MIEPDVAAIYDADVTAGGQRSVLARFSLSHWDAAVLAVALLTSVAFAPPLMFGAWTTRMAVMLLVAPAGLLLMALRARAGDIPAALLIGALGWAVLSAVLSPLPRSALIGTASRDLSVLTVVLAAGVWVLGRQVSSRGRVVAPYVVVWALVASALVGILQVLADVRSGPLGLAGGRPQGFAANPVYFGALCSAGLAAAVSLIDDWSRRWMWGAVLPLGIATSLSGSRVALLAAVLSAGLIVSVRRSRVAWLSATIAIGSLAAGVGMDRLFGAGRNAADRLISGSGGGRTQVWWYGLEAWVDRPILGHGIGRFRPAVQHRFSADFVQKYAVDEITQAWFDPHNLLVNVLVTTGAVGFVAFVAWVAACGVRCRGPLAFALVPIGLSWMLQPVGIVVLPLAALMLGVAMSGSDEAVVINRRVLLWLGSVGALMALYVLAADVELRRAADALDGPRAARAASLYADDSVVADVVAQVYRFDDSIPDRAERRLDWQRTAAFAEPDRPYWWSQLAIRYIEAGSFDEAQDSLVRARELQPFNIRTLRVEVILALRSGDDDSLESLLADSCELGLDLCGSDVDQIRADFTAAIEDGGG